MGNFFKLAMVSSGLLVALPAVAKVAGVTADGTWDCIDKTEAFVGTVVIADTSYAFAQPDGHVEAYGKLHSLGFESYDLPAFVIVDGYLKDKMAAVGTTMAGPRGNEHDLSGEHFLSVVITDDNKLYCTRRKQPAP